MHNGYLYMEQTIIKDKPTDYNSKLLAQAPMVCISGNFVLNVLCFIKLNREFNPCSHILLNTIKVSTRSPLKWKKVRENNKTVHVINKFKMYIYFSSYFIYFFCMILFAQLNINRYFIFIVF